MNAMSFNARLLAVFLNKKDSKSDVQSLRRHHQSLSIIYINISLFVITYGFELTLRIFGDRPSTNWLQTLTLAPIMMTSLVFLRNEKYDASAMMVVILMHLVNFFAAFFQKQFLPALFGLMIAPNSCFFISNSIKIQMVNIIITIGQFFHHIHNVQRMFQITHSPEQADQIKMLHSAIFFCMTSLCVAVFIQKSIEVRLWEMADSSNQKSEKLLGEVLQASKAKDVFVSSVSHEIRNPLNCTSGAIDYLIQTVESAEIIAVLRNAQINTKILSNIVNNILDAAKLSSDKFEIMYSFAEFKAVLTTVLTTNYETIRRKRIKVEAVIDQNLPETFRTDPSRLLQIMMNLVSNALKFTSDGDQVKITATLCSEKQDQDLFSNKNDYSSSSRVTIHTITAATTANLKANRLPTNNELFLNELSSEDHIVLERNIRTLNRPTVSSKHSNTKSGQPLLEPDLWKIEHKLLSNPQTRSEAERKYLRVEIADTGPGISRELLPNLFQMFKQSQERASDVQGGVGLGLWICKQLCCKMSGDIKIHSEVNRGTTVIFYIPVE